MSKWNVSFPGSIKCLEFAFEGWDYSVNHLVINQTICPVRTDWYLWTLSLKNYLYKWKNETLILKKPEWNPVSW